MQRPRRRGQPAAATFPVPPENTEIFKVAGRLCKAKNISRLNGLKANSRSPANREFAQHNRELFHSNRELTGIYLVMPPAASDRRLREFSANCASVECEHGNLTVAVFIRR